MTLMNRDDWKHLEAAARSIGSALSLDVEILQHDEDYPQLQIGSGYYIQWSTDLNKWLFEKAEFVKATGELDDVDIVQICAAKQWSRLLYRAYRKITDDIVNAVIEAEGLAQDLDKEKIAKLRRVK